MEGSPVRLGEEGRLVEREGELEADVVGSGRRQLRVGLADPRELGSL